MLRDSFGDRMTGAVFVGLLALAAMAVLYPLLFVISSSLSEPRHVLQGDVWLWPRGLTLETYARVFGNRDIMIGYLNTIGYAAVGTAMNVVLTTMAAYTLSRREYVLRNFFTALMVFSMFFSGGLIPMYLLMKDLQLLDTMWAVLLPGAVSVWNVMLMRTYFQTAIPYELQESAQLDGCSHTGALFRVILPLSMPILAVMTLFYAVGHWNAFFNALIYLSDRERYPLQLILREILLRDQMEGMASHREEDTLGYLMQTETLKYAVVIAANLPMLALYPFLQKYFVKGIMIGSLKG